MKSKEITAKHIMESALTVFAEKGLNEVTVRDIARSAGTSTAKIYRVFTNKEELLAAILADRLAEMTVNLREHLQGIIGTKNKLRKFMWFMLHFQQSHPDLASVGSLAIPHRLWSDLPTGTALQDQGRILAEIVDEGQRAGEVRQDVDMKALRDLFFGGLERVTFHWLVRGRPGVLTDSADELTELLFGGIRKSPEESPPFNSHFTEELKALKEALDVLTEEIEALKEAQH
jgi:TetR/AcrR family fatty acid metabolism transcriptional regulator